MEQYIEDLFYHKYRSSVARLRISAHLLPIETGRMMNKPREHRMRPFCLNKQVGDEHHYIFKCTHPKFITIRTKLFQAIFELAGQNYIHTYRIHTDQNTYIHIQCHCFDSTTTRFSNGGSTFYVTSYPLIFNFLLWNGTKLALLHGSRAILARCL